MTYIIAGKLPNSTFMMSDCIVTNSQTNENTFFHKMIKLTSSISTYYSFTGVQFIDNCVRTYDFWLNMHNKVNDFVDGTNSINELKKVIEKMIETFPDADKMNLEKNRLFFVNQTSVVYYDLEYNENHELKREIEKFVVEENEFIDSSVLTHTKQGIPEMEVEDFCKNYLKYFSKGNVDFKDRFSFVYFKENDIIFKEPFKHFSDLIAMYNNIDAGKIDDPDFIWTF